MYVVATCLFSRVRQELGRQPVFWLLLMSSWDQITRRVFWSLMHQMIGEIFYGF